MRVLWITNVHLPAVCKEIGHVSPVYGGWIYASLNALRDAYPEIEFAVATLYNGENFRVVDDSAVKYFMLPSKLENTTYDKSLEILWHKVHAEFRPDVVHIHGTEFPLGLSYIRACGSMNVCISIQGLVSEIAKFYYAGITKADIIYNITIRDILRCDSIIQQRNKFKKRGEYEIEYISSVPNIIGRTSWDRAHIWAINPNAQYYFCNETLRSVFYQYRWRYNNCEKHTIFLSQAGYTIKGLHKVLEAMPLVLRHFPDARIRIAGENIIDKPFYRITGYGKYIRSLIKKFNLEGKISFLGILQAEQMCEEYLRANVFICPSSIENSPNSLGEAQILGTPHIAANVGGVCDMMVSNEDCLYQFEEVVVLAEKICKVFAETVYEDCVILEEAKKRHNRTLNTHALVNIYKEITK